MQIILFTYSCIIMKTLENDNNRGNNNGNVPHGQNIYVTISVVTGKCITYPFDKRFVRFLYATYSFCLSYIHCSSVCWLFFAHYLSGTYALLMRFMCFLHIQRRPSSPPRRLSPPDKHFLYFFCPFGVR